MYIFLQTLNPEVHFSVLAKQAVWQFRKPTYNTFVRPVLKEILSSKKFKVLYKLRAIHPNTPGRYAGGQGYTH